MTYKLFKFKSTSDDYARNLYWTPNETRPDLEYYYVYDKRAYKLWETYLRIIAGFENIHAGGTLDIECNSDSIDNLIALVEQSYLLTYKGEA